MPARTFDHRPRRWQPDDPECWVCGTAINPANPTLHEGEAPRERLTADPGDGRVLDYATRVIRAEVAELPIYLTPEQLDRIARRAAEAIYYRGGLRTRRASWVPADHAA